MKVVFLLPIFLCMAILNASEVTLNAPCFKDNPKLPAFGDLQHIKEHLEFYSASDELIEKAVCKSLKAPSKEELVSYIIEKSEMDSTKKYQMINGVVFENESPVLIKAFEDLTTAIHVWGYKKQPERQKIFQVSKECKKVLCAVNEIWGTDMGPKVLYVLLKHNFNTSEYAYDFSDRLQSDEMDDVLIGLSDLPMSFVPLVEPNRRLTHFNRGKVLGEKLTPVIKDSAEGQSHTALANATIMLFDSWSNSSRLRRQYAIFHELSHNVSSRLNHFDVSPEWLKLSKWVKKGDQWETENFQSMCNASYYGAKNPLEDFAESMSAYRYNGSKFKDSCPEKYDLFKNKVFKGLEYIDENSCLGISNESLNSIASETVSSFKNKIETNPNISKLKKDCISSFYYFPIREEDIDLCVEKIIGDVARQLPEDELEKLSKKYQIADKQYLELRLSLPDVLFRRDEIVLDKKILSNNIKKSTQEYFDEIINENLPKKNGNEYTSFNYDGFHRSFFEKCKDKIAIKEEALGCAKNMVIELIEKRPKSFSFFYAVSSKDLFRNIVKQDGLNKDLEEALEHHYALKLSDLTRNSDLISSQVELYFNHLKQ